MLAGKCDQCPAESSHLDLFAGQKLKCKKCPHGWVNLPAKAGAVFAAPAAIVLAPAPAVLVPPPPPRPVKVADTPSLPPELRPDAFAKPDVEPGLHFMTYFLWMTTVYGFCSIWLDFFDLQFARLAFLERLQPFAGMVMAAAGIAGLVWWYRRGKQF